MATNHKHQITNHAENYCQIAFEWAREAAGDKKGVRHNKWARLAAQRHLDDLKKQGEDYGYVFDEWYGNDVCDFIEKLPHVEGEWDTPTITLEAPQIFFLVVAFGWRRLDNYKRRFTKIYLEMAASRMFINHC